MDNFLNRFLKSKRDGENTNKPTSPESGLDVPPSVDPAYFSEILHHLESNGFDQSKASASIIRNLGAESTKTGEYVSFSDITIKQATEIALDPSHPIHKEIIDKKKGISESKRNMLGKAYDETFNPNQQFADLGDTIENEEKGGTRID
ncbi:MAG: hypothetical protein K9M36_01120 [Candidatus Pacebacteria bacterium]|nr:hypothetical protein [Candidatus Paceibacterota bacterium]